MSQAWGSFLWQRLRPTVLVWGVVVLVTGLVVAVAWYLRYRADVGLEVARAALSDANAQADEVRAQYDLIQQHAATYRQWRDALWIGDMPVAERRALWAQQLQQAVQSLGPWAIAGVVFELQPPAQANAPTESGATDGEPAGQPQASVHPLRVRMSDLHDVEALRVWLAIHDVLGEPAHTQGCQWRRQAETLQVECGWNLHYVRLPEARVPTESRP